MQRKRITKRYMKAVGALYGTQIELTGVVTPKKKSSNSDAVVKPKAKCLKEFQEQIKAVFQIKQLGLEVHHSPNGGRRDAREGAKFKAMGVSAGFPDLIITYARKGYHGLFIEIKPVIGGVLSDSQKRWGAHLLKEGYAWYEAKGAAEVMKIVYDYFGIST